MKNIICVFIVLFSLTVSFGQETIKNYPGIPIITYRGCVISNSVGGPYLTVDDFKYADSSGIFAMQLDNVNAAEFNTFIAPTNLLVMPSEIDKTLTDYILTYTEGRYTEFEAEGTPWEDGVTLYRNETLNLFVGNGAVSTTPLTEHGTMIYGPMYRQCRNYLAVTPGPIPYRASYIIKIDDIDPWLDSSPEDTVCILQVTSTRTWKECEWYIGLDTFKTQYYSGFEETLVHADTVITYGDLQPSIWDTVHLNYIFDHNVPWFGPASNPYQVVSKYGSNNENMLDEHISQNCVEFKVIWKGKNDRVRLSLDKIIVSDQRGRELKNPVFFSHIAQNIRNQIDTLSLFTQNRSVGFIGVDEPWSLDQWEPIRMVNEIVDSYRPNNKWFELYYQFNLQAFGRFSWPEDPALGSHVIMIDEFMKRVGKANVWITGWLYDVPCDGFTPDPPCADFILPRPICNEAPDFRVVNIDHLADSIYKRVVQASENYPGLYYGMSTQTGRYHAPVREINGREMLYTNNLALLYGSKLLSPWLYFTWDYPWVPGSYTGISNLVAPSTHELTDKYWTLRDTIAPRLNGLMGRTLKKLKPLEQYAGSNGINALVHPENSVPHDYVGYINALGGFADICFIELGFFEEPQFPDKHYFMPLNRYYSTLHNLKFGLINLTEYKNWKITDYVDTTHFTLVANDGEAEFYEAIYQGDAKLYSIAPTVKYGGDLLANETISGTNTLTESDLIIKNGARLTVSGNYTLNKDIIVEQGGELVLNAGASLFFNGNARLTVFGKFVSNGLQNNKVSMTWNQTQGSGISLRKYNKLQNIRFTGADIAININLSGQRDSTSIIRNCEFINCNTGIVVTNTNSVLIQNNSITQSRMGIFLSNVSSFNIVSNNLESTNRYLPGIFVNSSSGNIRSNTITGFSNGIVCANSSPVAGGNFIYDNAFHGMYVGEGSQPDLRGALLYIAQCSNPPLYYPLSGYNHIFENGGLSPAPIDDGSEIFIYNSNILLDHGSNCITDTREERYPVYTSRLLVNGNVDILIPAAFNEWGWHPDYTIDQRFGIPIQYEPIGSCALPDNLIDCPLVVTTIDGIVIDTIYAVGEGNFEDDEIKELFAQAEIKYLENDLNGAKTIYNQIITDYPSLRSSFSAYSRLLSIERIENVNPEAFGQLRDFYLMNLNNVADTLLQKMIMQLANLALIQKGDLNDAINEFQTIISNYPGSEAADFAEIDIYTAALLKPDSVLAKGKLIKVTEDNYPNLVSSIIKKRFGMVENQNEKSFIPTEYVLYQNYPNPFNPSTTIKFDLPKDGVVELGIYDILGRKITTLINEYRNAGSYEQNFNASSLASGIYLYSIKVNDFVSAKKMILVK